jgi:cysteine-rich repeat protein
MPRLNVVFLGAALVSIGGCSVFDAKLWMDNVPRDAAPPADAAPPEDAPAYDHVAPEPDAPPADVNAADLLPPEDLSPPEDALAHDDLMPPAPDAGAVVLADRCETAATVTSQGMILSIDTSKLANDYSELAACAGHDLPGNDGFLTVEMMAGEKWHVHVNPLVPDFDPAIYILSSCDTRACSTITAIDECGPGKSEHLSFIAPQTGMFRVGVDSVSAGGAATLVLVKPVCGNGMVEHSETCDDGNTAAGDGCDSLCRKELGAAAVTEIEPNDDARAANVLGLHPAGSMRVSGSVGTRCDHDMYSVTLAQTGTIRASIAAMGIPCAADGAPVKIVLLGADGLTPVNAGIIITNDCPMLEAKNLPPGEYFLVVRRPGGDAIFSYQMVVETP